MEHIANVLEAIGQKISDLELSIYIKDEEIKRLKAENERLKEAQNAVY